MMIRPKAIQVVRRTTLFFPWILLVALSVHLTGQWIVDTTSSKRYLDLQSPSRKQDGGVPAEQQPVLRAGWHTIQVFYGDRDLVIPDNSTENDQWFSQAKQDQIVSSLLRNQRGGFFIDLAANAPVHISNTFALERKFGWTGAFFISFYCLLVCVDRLEYIHLITC